MTFKVTILGSSSATPTLARHHSAHALNVHEQFYLVDCGEGSQRRLMQCGINPLKINAVFLSHMHGDHIYGIFPLISSLSMLGRRVPLKVFAPAPFGELMECHDRLLGIKTDFEVQWIEVDTRAHACVYENKVMEVWTVPLRHRVPAAGYIFREKTPQRNVSKYALERYGLDIAQIVAAKRGDDVLVEGEGLVKNDRLTYLPYEPRSYAYCSDTLYSGKVASLVTGVDLLYHEATFAADEKRLAEQTGHSTTLQAAKCASVAGAGKLLIGHFSGRYKDVEPLLDEARTVFPDTEIAAEGHTYEIKAVRP